MSFIKAVSSLPSQRGIPSRIIYDSLGISQQLLSHWIKRGWIRPSIRVGRRGNTKACGALWSFYDVLDIKTILGLRRAGLSMHKVVKVIKWLRENGHALHSANLATDGENVFINLNEQALEIVKATGQLILLDWTTIVKHCLDLLEQKGVDI